MNSKKKYKILFITHSYAMTGGAEDEFERLLNYFSTFPDKYEVHGLFPKGERSLIYSRYCSRFSYYRYGHLPVTNDGLWPYVKYFMKSAIQIFQVLKFSIGQKYDLAVINVVVLIWPVIALKLLCVKVVVFVREDIYPLWLRHLIYRVFGLIADYIIPNSDTKLNDLRAITKTERNCRIYPAIEEIEICSLTELENKIGTSSFRILTNRATFKFINPARLLNKKNQLLLLKALNAIRSMDDCEIPQLVFLGYYDRNADYGKVVLEYIEENSLGSYVLFLGELDRKYLYCIYQLIDSVIISSLSEGMPVVLVEAFKFRKPFISTKVGGIPEVVKHLQTGMLINFEESDAAKNMIEIMQNENLRNLIQRNAFDFYKTHFELEQILLKTEHIFNEVMTTKT